MPAPYEPAPGSCTCRGMIDGSWALEYAAILMLDSPDRPLPLRAVISSGEKVASALLLRSGPGHVEPSLQPIDGDKAKKHADAYGRPRALVEAGGGQAMSRLPDFLDSKPQQWGSVPGSEPEPLAPGLRRCDRVA